MGFDEIGFWTRGQKIRASKALIFGVLSFFGLLIGVWENLPERRKIMRYIISL